MSGPCRQLLLSFNLLWKYASTGGMDFWRDAEGAKPKLRNSRRTEVRQEQRGQPFVSLARNFSVFPDDVLRRYFGNFEQPTKHTSPLIQLATGNRNACATDAFQFTASP